jgi:hypothetical protein
MYTNGYKMKQIRLAYQKKMRGSITSSCVCEAERMLTQIRDSLVSI